HLAQEFLGKRDGIVSRLVVRLQQPARQAGADVVQRVAGRSLLDLPQQHLIVCDNQVRQMLVLHGEGTKALCRNAESCPGYLHQRAYAGDARAQSDSEADRSLRSDRTDFYGAVLGHFNDQRDHPALREMHKLDTLASFLQKFPLLDRHLAQVLAEARELLRFERGKYSVAIARQEYFS